MSRPAPASGALLSKRIVSATRNGVALQLAADLVEAQHRGDDDAVGRLCAAATADQGVAIATLIRLSRALANLAGPGG